MNPRISEIFKGLKNVEKHLIFEPINDATLDRMKHSIGEILNRFASEQKSIDRYLVVTPDLSKPDCILFTHTDDAPQWVKDIFHQMRGDVFQVDFTITKDNEITDLTSSWKPV